MKWYEKIERHHVWRAIVLFYLFIFGLLLHWFLK